MPNPENLIGKGFKPGQSGNPAGQKPGTIHLSTHIQNMLNDPDFIPEKLKEQGFSGTPIKAILITAVKKAESGDNKWAEWLAKHGYGEKINLEHSGEINGSYDPKLAADYADYVKKHTGKT